MTSAHLATKSKPFSMVSKKEYIVPAIIGELENMEYAKTSQDKYMRKYAMTGKQKKY